MAFDPATMMQLLHQMMAPQQPAPQPAQPVLPVAQQPPQAAAAPAQAPASAGAPMLQILQMLKSMSEQQAAP